MNWACPQEIQDIADAAYFQPTLVHYGPLKMLRYLGYGVAKFWEMPLNLPILCLGGVSFMLFITNKKLNECLYMMGMWLFPYLYVAVSNCYFIYHFVVFVFAAVLTFYLTKDYWKQIMTKQLFVGLWIVFLAGLVCTFEPIFDISIRIRNMLFLVPYVVMTFALVEKWRTKVLSIGVLFLVFTFIATISAFSYPQMGAKKMDKMTNEKNEKKGYRMGMKLGEDCVLQLNAGLGSLWFSNLSYLRYLYPLILEGRNESSHIKQSSFFVETKEKIIDYQGEYIVTDWEYSKKMDDGIQAFIEEHYYTSDTLYYYGFYYDLYDYKEKTFEFYILKRKGIDYNNEPVITE
jgi:hypothetical protein